MPNVLPAPAPVPVAPPPSQVGPSLLRVVTPAGVQAWDKAQQEASSKVIPEEQVMDNLAAFVRGEWQMMKNHRDSEAGWSNRLLDAVRMFNRKYDSGKLAEIKKFGGSDIYAGQVALKCRGASALLREVYLGIDKPWGLDPTPDPTLPENVLQSIADLVSVEAAAAHASGQQLNLNDIKDRTNALVAHAQRAAKTRAKEQAKSAEDKLDDYLVEGEFYTALAEFITDLPLFPFACIKGPIVRVVADVAWENGQAVEKRTAKMFWERKSPFDIYFTPGVSRIRDGAVIEKMKLSRADLNDVLGLPGYHEENIRKVLDEYGRGGLVDWIDTTDSERAIAENRENPQMNRSGLLDCLEYHGNVQGRLLIEHGLQEGTGPDQINDKDRDYFVQVWLIGRYVIKAQISPNPRKRHPYYITSFEKVPGTPVGNALPDILGSTEDACNAFLRSLINNVSLSSGPQVVIDDSRLSPNQDSDDLYPWKRWHVSNDPTVAQSNTVPPIIFFQPQSNAQELLAVYTAFTNIGDEISAIPRYITGSDKIGGAGRTASGLAMLMGNASKVLQMVASNIDRDVIRDLLQGLYDMVMLTDTSGTFRGDESINVRGVEVAVQRETTRQRALELLQATMNPMDMQILGVEGRSKLLREVSSTVGIQDEIVPSVEDLRAQMAPRSGALPGAPGGPPAGESAAQGGGQPGEGQLPPMSPGPPPQVMLPAPGQVRPPASADLGESQAQTVRGIA